MNSLFKLFRGDCITIIPLLVKYSLRQEFGGINCNKNPTSIVLNTEQPCPDRIALCDEHLELAKQGKIDCVWNKIK